MKPISLSLPQDAEVYNVLYPTKDPEYLTQDLLTVGLPNGYCIDVGWYPEHDPRGQYKIRVFHLDWENQQIEPIETADLNEVVATVHRLVARFEEKTVH